LVSREEERKEKEHFNAEGAEVYAEDAKAILGAQRPIFFHHRDTEGTEVKCGKTASVPSVV
jgi:hypothetical protein